MKNQINVIVMIIFIVCFCTLSFYFWFNYFTNLGINGDLTGVNNKNSTLVFTDEDKIYASFKEGIEEPIDVEGYKFKIENKGNKEVRYELMFIEILPSQVNDGCNNKTTLRADELNYQLSLEGKVISQGRVDQIAGKTLDLRTIDGFKNYNYVLKVWLNSSSENNEGKHYHYNVDLKVSDK